VTLAFRGTISSVCMSTYSVATSAGPSWLSRTRHARPSVLLYDQRRLKMSKAKRAPVAIHSIRQQSSQHTARQRYPIGDSCSATHRCLVVSTPVASLILRCLAFRPYAFRVQEDRTRRRCRAVEGKTSAIAIVSLAAQGVRSTLPLCKPSARVLLGMKKRIQRRNGRQGLHLCGGSPRPSLDLAAGLPRWPELPKCSVPIAI